MGSELTKRTAIFLSAALLLTGCSGGNTVIPELPADSAFYTDRKSVGRERVC